MHGQDVSKINRYRKILNLCKVSCELADISRETKVSNSTLFVDLRLLSAAGYLNRKIVKKVKSCEQYEYTTIKNIETDDDYYAIKKLYGTDEYRKLIARVRTKRAYEKKQDEVIPTNGYENGIMIVAMKHIPQVKLNRSFGIASSFSVGDWS